MLVVGQDKQLKYFSNLIKNKALGHAYIFTGPEMIGKKTFAFELAKILFGDDFNNNPDFKFITPNIEDGESRIFIKDIRDLKKSLSLKSYGGSFRLVVINDAHSITAESANAFLKLLEEPPRGTTIILVSSTPGLLPVTILSRCEEVRFNLVGDNVVATYLSGQKKKLSSEDREFIIKLSRGRLGLVSYLLEDKNLDNAKKAVDDLRKLFKTGIYERMNYVKKLNEDAVRRGTAKEDYGQLVSYWLSWVSAHVASSPKNEKMVKELLVLASLTSQSQFNHRLAMENFLLNL